MALANLNIKAPKLDGAPRGDGYCYAAEIAVSSVLGLVVAAVGVWWICIGKRSSRNPQLGKERRGNRKDGTMSRDGYTVYRVDRQAWYQRGGGS
jgi:hypothetical protein